MKYGKKGERINQAEIDLFRPRAAQALLNTRFRPCKGLHEQIQYPRCQPLSFSKMLYFELT